MSDKTISLPRYLPIKWKSQWKICKHTEFNYALTIKVRWQRLIIIFIIKCRVYFGIKYEIYDEFGVANAQCWVKSSYMNVYTSLTFVWHVFAPFYVNSHFSNCVSRISLNFWSRISREFANFVNIIKSQFWLSGKLSCNMHELSGIRYCLMSTNIWRFHLNENAWAKNTL